MNLTQNDRLNQVTADTLVVGVDIGSETHFARYSGSVIHRSDFSHLFAGSKR